MAVMTASKVLPSPYVRYLICGCLSRRAAVEKLHCVDDAFRRQLESVQVAHQAELLQLANEKQKKIEEANQKVKCRKAFTEVVLILD